MLLRSLTKNIFIFFKKNFGVRAELAELLWVLSIQAVRPVSLKLQVPQLGDRKRVTLPLEHVQNGHK